MPRDARGLLASPGVDALIGGEILSRFTVTFDYQNQRILFKPVGHFADPFGADASGLSLRVKDAEFGSVEIANVEPDSAAATAGLQVGDVISAIDGRSAGEFDLDKVRKMFSTVGPKDSPDNGDSRSRSYLFTGSTSFANPAVTIARSLSDTFAGIQLSDVPAFIAAQLAGALSATFVFRRLVLNLSAYADRVVVPRSSAHEHGYPPSGLQRQCSTPSPSLQEAA